MATAAVDKDEEDMIESVLNDMVNSIVRIEERGTSSIVDPHVGSRVCGTSADARKSDLEAKMRRVLRAYAVYNPRVGYCQGMGFLVRLLAEVADDEADIFWLFVGFSEPENNQNLYEPGMIVLQPYLSKFELLFSTHMPKLYSHFMAEGVHVATFCTRWFLTFFSSFETLAPTLVIRLLDIFIIDGWRIMFSVSLVILDELQQQLLKHDMEGILRILQFPRSFMPEVDESRQQQLVRHALAFSMSRTINSA
uniref:Rab-GAP TBC domain-containing protein n=1 Tax=Hyaloperonospora arabidopsidis (strain Emoy2) TaxID=559515 RepID=M4B4F2_HYAAE